MRSNETGRGGECAAGAARRRRTAEGFTIVEIIVVVIIIAALATMIVPRFFGRVGTARRAVAAQMLREIEKAIELFAHDYGRWPEALDELITRPADIAEAKWQQPTLREKDLSDPWGRRFGYKCPGDHGAYDVYSLGADGEPGGEGENTDVTNW